MGPSPDVLLDGGFQTGSYGFVLNGFYYAADTISHKTTTSSARANKANGTPAGGAHVRGPEMISAKIKARTGVPRPAPRIPFRASFSDEPPKNWVVTSTTIESSNEGASIRTYSADIEEYINPIPATL